MTEDQYARLRALTTEERIARREDADEAFVAALKNLFRADQRAPVKPMPSSYSYRDSGLRHPDA